MKKKKKPSRLFYQYLFSYLCILLIPLFIVSAFVYYYVLNMLKEEVQTNNLHSLQRARDTIEVQMKYITSLENSVYLGNSLDQFYLENDVLKAMEIQKELRKYLRSNPFISDIAYYQENDDYMITASSSSRKELFFTRMYSFSDWDYERFLRDLEENNSGFFIGEQEVMVKSSENKPLVTFTQPLKEKTASRCVLYLIEASFLKDVMPSMESEKGCSAIVDKNGQVIVSEGNRNLMDELPKEDFDPEDMQGHVNILGITYLMSYVHSERFEWSYITLTLENDIGNRVDRVRLLMTFMCLFAATGGLIGVIFFAKQNYAPIYKLENMTNSILKKQKSGNEIDHVAQVLEYLDQQNKRLTLDAKMTVVALRERFIVRFLSGQYESREMILEKAGSAGIQLDKKQYCAAVVIVNQLPPGMDQMIEDVFLGAIPKNIQVLARVQPEMRRILVVVGFDMSTEDRIEKYFCDMLEIMQSDMELKGIIGMGSPVQELMKVSCSYREAVTALDYRIVLYDKKIIHYEEILLRGENKLKIQPRELSSFIKNKNMEGMEGFLKAALEEMVWKKPDIKQIGKQCNEFIYTIEKIINDMNRDYFIEKPLYYDISNVLKYENCRELMEIIHLIGCDIINHLNELNGKTFLESLILYVKDNCFSFDFSTTAMAEEFKISLPYLSQYFKSHTGMNLLDHVTNIKIERAKELLTGTDMPVKDVAENIGYYNVNSFNRRFKQITGYTPGEFRKMKL